LTVSTSQRPEHSRSGNSWTPQAESAIVFPIGNITVTVERIGTIVRQTRMAQGLRQDQLAAAAGVGLRFLVELERGKPTVRLDKVLAVLRALGCRLNVTPPPAPTGHDA
jgi:y4mF family transcriptional regulator